MMSAWKRFSAKKRTQTFGTLALPGHPLSCKGELWGGPGCGSIFSSASREKAEEASSLLTLVQTLVKYASAFSSLTFQSCEDFSSHCVVGFLFLLLHLPDTSHSKSRFFAKPFGNKNCVKKISWPTSVLQILNLFFLGHNNAFSKSLCSSSHNLKSRIVFEWQHGTKPNPACWPPVLPEKHPCGMRNWLVRQLASALFATELPCRVRYPNEKWMSEKLEAIKIRFPTNIIFNGSWWVITPCSRDKSMTCWKPWDPKNPQLQI